MHIEATKRSFAVAFPVLFPDTPNEVKVGYSRNDGPLKDKKEEVNGETSEPISLDTHEWEAVMAKKGKKKQKAKEKDKS